MTTEELLQQNQKFASHVDVLDQAASLANLSRQDHIRVNIASNELRKFFADTIAALKPEPELLKKE